MIELHRRLAAAAAVCLALAACDDGGSDVKANKGSTAPIQDPAAQAAKACIENMRLAVAGDPRMKAFAGKEGPLCACLVGKVETDKSLKEADRTPIYAALRTKPGSTEAREADRALSPAGRKAVRVAMVACGKAMAEK